MVKALLLQSQSGVVGFPSARHALPAWPAEVRLRPRRLQQLHGDARAGLGVGQGMVMMRHVVAAGPRHGVELVVGKVGKLVARGPERVEEKVVGIVHPVAVEHRFQAAFC